MKNYWKYIVIALLGGIALFHLTALWFIRGQNYELTSPDYYAQELKHQEMIDKLREGKSFVWECDVAEDGQSLVLDVKDLNGQDVALHEVKATLYRPDSAGLDQELLLAANEPGRYTAPINALKPGPWKVTVMANHQANDGMTEVAWQTRMSVR